MSERFQRIGRDLLSLNQSPIVDDQSLCSRDGAQRGSGNSRVAFGALERLEHCFVALLMSDVLTRATFQQVQMVFNLHQLIRRRLDDRLGFAELFGRSQNLAARVMLLGRSKQSLNILVALFGFAVVPIERLPGGHRCS